MLTLTTRPSGGTADSFCKMSLAFEFRVYIISTIGNCGRLICRSGGTADAHDSKSCGKPCGFKSHLRHQKKQDNSHYILKLAKY